MENKELFLEEWKGTFLYLSRELRGKEYMIQKQQQEIQELQTEIARLKQQNEQLIAKRVWKEKGNYRKRCGRNERLRHVNR